MIEGEKIILDRVEEKHLPQLLEWRNDPENRKFYREYRVLTIEDKKKWYNDKILNDNSWQFFVVKPKEKKKIKKIMKTKKEACLLFLYLTRMPRP